MTTCSKSERREEPTLIRFSLLRNDPFRVTVDTENREYVKDIKEYLTHYVEGWKFMPAYRAGSWDGKMSLFNMGTLSFPYGLFMDVYRYSRKEWKDLRYIIDPNLTEHFTGIEVTPTWDLLHKPYDYQEESIMAALNVSKGIVRIATSGGKSLVISYIIKTLLEHKLAQKNLIIVPTVGLVTQFHSDMIEYGIPEKIVGRVSANWKEFDKPIVVSTWQSLKNNMCYMDLFDAVFVDEVHGVRGRILSEIVMTAKNARWRLGFTGTMPESTLEQLQVKSYLGPILKDFSSMELAKRGYVSKCNIKMIHLEYENQPRGEYDEVKDQVFNNPYRMEVIRKIINDADGSVLLLVGKVEKEGEILCNFLEKCPEMSGKEIMFLSGRDDADEREKWRKYMENSKTTVLIATYGIFSTGVNIKSLRHLILASPFKSKIRVLQSIGRALRLHADKVFGAVVWDLCDDVKFLDKHTNIRVKHYNHEKFPMEDIFLKEGGPICFSPQ